MTKRFFITGTDTDIGKTLVACALLQSITKAGYRTAGYKPVATGCEMTPEGLRNHDALALIKNSSATLCYEQVNPLAFLSPTSPHIASRDAGQYIDVTLLSAGLRKLEDLAEWVIIEGAGGWFTPLAKSLTYADWVIAEQLPVVMVVGIKLGCINHALLTQLAIENAKLPLLGWIANHPIHSSHQLNDYILTLTQYLNAPFLGEIPWLNVLDQDNLTNYINFSYLETLTHK
ncbi:dethiobiotin synthase [secondary endosymbiont of Heteropsylla cubana]|uniref:ATP-dependent dethiobiotin synthetase BioD n=1 Tax=secondary endosymbiont of Heteropsylla cubana TaxID=134287 RepID=J3TYK4_9ENTR|nr:dethiobiotin synthase [secondary endosymbiont of Heteropsylla cubana]AFP85465.1 dethiobiotin synthase [secondary endosymbiont of Heteropsylla cubana]